jgi:sec-independent protein translocase protein TatA
MGIGVTEYLLIAVVLLILFGPKKLPELGRALGKMIREFKNGTQGILDADDHSDTKDKPVADATTKSVAAVGEDEKKQVDSRRLPD